MTFEDFDSTFRMTQVVDTYILPLFLVWYHARAQSNKPTRIPSLIFGLYFVLAGLFASILFFYIQRGWMYSFKIWVFKVHTISWNYAWYCGIICLFYFGFGSLVFYLTLRPKKDQ